MFEKSINELLSRRRFLAASGVAAGGAILAGCGGGSSTTGGKPVEIEYWHQFSKASGSDAMDDLIRQFNATNPDIVVKSTYKDAEAQPLEILQPAFVGGAAPDVGAVNYVDLGTLVDNQFPFVPVSELSSKYGNDGAKPQVPANLLEASAVRGQQIALPLYCTLMVGIYNADALRQAAVDASSITTWDGWRDAAAKLAGVSKEPSTWLHISADPYWATQNLVRSNGGRILGCASNKAVAAFAQPPAIEAMNFWSGMVNDGTCAIFPSTNAYQAFLSGQLKVLFTSAGAWESLKSQASFPVEGASMPQFGSKPRQLPIAGKAMVCFAKADAKRSASWRLMEFLASGKAQAKFADATGYVPVSTDVPTPTEPFQQLVLSELPAAVGPESFPGANGSHAQAEFGGGVMGMFSKKQQPAAVLPPLASQVDGFIKGQRCA